MTTTSSSQDIPEPNTPQPPLQAAQGPVHAEARDGQGEGTSATEIGTVGQPQAVRWAAVPIDLRERWQWCLASPTEKRPLRIDGRPASSTDPTSWTDFDTACAAADAKGWDVGYVLTADDPFTCIDMDVKDDTPAEHLERFRQIVDQAASFTEYSRSGRGLHVWVRGNIGAGCRRDGVEVYSSQRFMIVTGNVYRGSAIEDRQLMLDSLVSKMRPLSATAEPIPDGHEVESDEAILQRANAAANGSKFAAHYHADFAAIGHTDHSIADMALLGILAPYTQNNAQLKRLFLGSALGQRDKAQKRQDYVDRTIRAVRAQEASGPTVAHGEQIVHALVFNALLKRLRPPQPHIGMKTLRLISEQEMANRPSVRWRVRGLIPEEGLVAVFGPPSAGKSFLVLDLLAAVSSRDAWFGHKVRPAPVVYAALEGQAGVAQRIQAYHARKGGMNNVKFIDCPIDLRRPDQRTALVDAVRSAGWAGGILCIDTLAASAPGVDENTSKEMGALIGALQEVQAELGGVVLLVHHTGKDEGRGPRGWSGLTGALDGAIKVSRDEAGRRTWKVIKAKDGADGDERLFDLEVVILGIDEDGLPITSCIVVDVGPNTASTQEANIGSIVEMIAARYDRGQYIATAPNSPNTAYKVLKDDPGFPRGLSSRALAALLRQAEEEGLVEREKYKDQHRNERERWHVLT